MPVVLLICRFCIAGPNAISILFNANSATVSFARLKMIKIQDILSLTEFHRHSREHIARLRATGRPEVLTVNGRAELVVQDASAYQHLLEQLQGDEETVRKKSKRKLRGKKGQ